MGHGLGPMHFPMSWGALPMGTLQKGASQKVSTCRERGLEGCVSKSCCLQAPVHQHYKAAGGGMKQFYFSQRPLAALAAASAVGVCAPAAPLLWGMSSSSAKWWVYWRAGHCRTLGEGEKWKEMSLLCSFPGIGVCLVLCSPSCEWG